MFHYEYATHGTCSKAISFDLDGDVVHNIKYKGGCSGNLSAIPLLLEGWTVDQIAEKLTGHHCGDKDTSCADQLTMALKAGIKARDKALASS